MRERNVDSLCLICSLANFSLARNPNEVEDSGSAVELFRTKSVAVKPGRGTLVSFIITPDATGVIDLKITAQSPVGKFSKVEQLTVETEGERMSNNSAMLLDLRQGGDQAR